MKKWNGRFNFFAGSQKMTYTERTWQVFVDRVVALWDQGLSVAEIAKKLDTSELMRLAVLFSRTVVGLTAGKRREYRDWETDRKSVV